MKFLLTFLFLLGSCFAQISSSGSYFGKIGGSDIVIGIARKDSVGVYFFDRVTRRLEFGTGALGADNKVTMASNLGRIITVFHNGLNATGTLGGITFSTQKVSPYGPFAGGSFGYTGTVVDLSRREASILLLSVYPDGRVLLLSSNSAADIGGVGTITSGGAVTVPMNNGVTWTFFFAPKDNVASGLITAPGYSNLEYVLVQGQRAPIVNIATRGTVGGENMLTAGFVTTTAGKTLLIRAVGPTLGSFGVGNAQTDTVLTLYSGNKIIATNDNWGAAANAADVPTASSQVGAFALPAGSKDAVLLVSLEPGAYTAQVTGSGPAGDALVEVYEIN